MIKKYTLLLISTACCLTIFAQGDFENNIKVQDVVSPSARTYNTVDSFDIVIRIQNLGPNALIPGDKFNISYSVGDGSINSQFFDTLLQVGGSRSMVVNEARVYTLANNFKINGNNQFSACADVSGTSIYTKNTNKDPGDCAIFIVNLEQEQLSIDKVYFADRSIYLSINKPEAIKLEVFDITGKLVLESSTKNQTNTSIPFDAPSSGFYFIKLTSASGLQTSSKFVVN